MKDEFENSPQEGDVCAEAYDKQQMTGFVLVAEIDFPPEVLRRNAELVSIMTDLDQLDTEINQLLEHIRIEHLAHL